MRKKAYLISLAVILGMLCACSNKGSQAAAKSYDIDLTKLNSIMAYSEVANMQANYKDYIGKTVRMSGQFVLYQAVDAKGQPVPNSIYFACAVTDSTSCCSQGLEFVRAGEFQYPKDYPELGSTITVSGTFATYLENGHIFCHLVDAVLE